MKSLSPLFFLLLFAHLLSAQRDFRVQVGVFENSVPSAYWSDLNNVQLSVDHNGLHRYYIGDFTSLTEADEVARQAQNAGFQFAKTVNLAQLRDDCSRCGVEMPAALFLRSIFFDFDKSNLRSESKSQLNILLGLMKTNMDYKVNLLGYTDSKGSDEYNQALSQRRSESAKQYLINNGIAANRISISYFGENDPIAKNESMTGQDSPQGRQYNRRVIIRLTDANGNTIPGIVKEVEVPSDLSTN